MRNRTHIIVLVSLLAGALLGAGSASAAPISPERLGVNVSAGAPDVSLASSWGLGTVRVQAIEGTNADPIVAWAARAQLRLAPTLGLPTQYGPIAAADAMARYVSAFAKRYGPGGTFWKQNPHLPYLPVEDYEIGNEPNLPLQYVDDFTNLHWLAPSSYARVYEASRAALHRVDPSGVAVVGGLADSGTPGVSLVDDERWLAALTPGQVDAVGFHPYTFPISFATMYGDTEGLRQWMNTHGMQDVPIEINEFGACDVLPRDTLETSGCAPSIPSGQWGTFVAAFTQWALCSPALNVQSVQPESWGDEPTTDVDALLALVSSSGVMTPYGRDYMGEARWLTTKGCSRLGFSHARVRGNLLTVIVRVTPASGRVVVLARQGHRTVRLRLAHHGRRAKVLRFRATLGSGRWRVIVEARSSSSYVALESTHHRVTVGG